MAVPILAPLKVKGGTFYTLSTAVDDLTYMFDNSSIHVSFSKFACLRLPKWANTVDDSMYLDPTLIGTPSVTSPNTVLPKIFQNYMENLLRYSEIDRLDNSLANYGEQAFWKTLRKIGGLSLTTLDTVVIGGETHNRYKEIADTSNYKQVVQYVGDINLLNHVKSDGQEYLEIFAHVPTAAGQLPHGVPFIPALSTVHSSSAIPSAGGSTTTYGLDDYVGTDNVTAIYDTVDRKYNVNSDLESAGLDFASIASLTPNDGDFDFNCVLIYYDVVDEVTPDNTRTNLYGFLILENFDDLSGGAYALPSLTKIQPSIDSSGNSFAFKLNLKFTANTNQVTSELSINDYSTVSMELYMDALRRLQVLTDQYAGLEKQFLSFSSRLNDLTDTKSKMAELTEATDVLEGLDRRVKIIETGQSGDYLRISNEELFILFSKVLTTAELSSTPIQLLVTSRAYLPKLLDRDQYIFEDFNGTQFRWNFGTSNWDIV